VQIPEALRSTRVVPRNTREDGQPTSPFPSFYPHHERRGRPILQIQPRITTRVTQSEPQTRHSFRQSWDCTPDGSLGLFGREVSTRERGLQKGWSVQAHGEPPVGLTRRAQIHTLTGAEDYDPPGK